MNVDDGSKKVKMYADEDGNFKGEALVSELSSSSLTSNSYLSRAAFYQRASIEQAIFRLDETDFHKGSLTAGSMRVQEADMSYKKQKEVPAGEKVQQGTRGKRDVEKIKALTRQQDAYVFQSFQHALRSLSDDL